MKETTWSDVDGVPALHCPGRGNVVRAGLVFRVGRADETLATAGITHLVEHLALHQQGLSDYHFNGTTDDLYTHFHVEGSAEHVVEYFDSVCASLRDLPLHRLETEKEILRTEEAGRGDGPARSLPLFRYGAQGHGLSSYQQLGLPALTAEKVAEWARSHFTRDNAVLWVVGDLPDGLHLDLPQGRRNPLPEVTSVLPETPAWVHVGGDAVFLHALVPRSTEAMTFARVLGKALFTDLRQRSGYSYTAQADYHPLDSDLATVVAVADSAPDKREAVVGAFVDVLARLRFGTITEAELESAKSGIRQGLEELEPSQVLPGYAVNALIGHPSLNPDELRAELEAVTVEDVRRVAKEVHSSALFQVPVLGLDWAGVAAAPSWSDSAVRGRAYAPCGDDAATLVVGGEGVSLRVGRDAATVRYADCVAVLAFPDGGRRLFGRDGFSVAVEPTLNKLAPSVVNTIDKAVPPSLVIPMPPRAEELIPQPSRTPEQAPQPFPSGELKEPTKLRALLRRTAFVIMWAIAAFFLVVALVGTVEAANGDPEMDPASAVVLWAFFAFPAWVAWKLRRPGRPRP